MKKIFLFFCATLMFSSFSTNAFVRPKKMTTKTIDAVWEKTTYITNLLPSEEKTQKYGKDEMAGDLYFFKGITDDAIVQISIITTPFTLGNGTGIYILINHKEVAMPKMISEQRYDYSPKLINGKIVIHIYNLLEKEYFYLVIDPNGSSYSTEVK